MEPNWLEEDELTTWHHVVQLFMLLPTALDRQLRDEAGIPHAYYMIMAILSEQPDRSMRMTELAKNTGTTTSRLSHAAATLEERGWLRREACASDKRGQTARLTDEGMAAVAAAAPGHVAEVRRLLFDHLSPDENEQLRAILAKVLPTLKA
ncbi:MarR family transcriptional regulator [Actinoplanes sp. TBRC 11911]|uniref:MarR family winged helix-turn-helix transcriptional regulator n=1 Tax=Actinoplanes sp. TBRC 11911 TaxID=2729386 RepID=UPI00145CD539|nr:MarR family transcriptional regulator [Actinoplanes sp. TBRC 11911]NMO56894.1 MarR family transcriptional regulator [Actinoplanes sp. TBRC 11911]